LMRIVTATPIQKLGVSTFIPPLTFLGVQRLQQRVLQFLC
jgi:hypothetical protein